MLGLLLASGEGLGGDEVDISVALCLSPVELLELGSTANASAQRSRGGENGERPSHRIQVPICGLWILRQVICDQVKKKKKQGERAFTTRFEYAFMTSVA